MITVCEEQPVDETVTTHIDAASFGFPQAGIEEPSMQNRETNKMAKKVRTAGLDSSYPGRQISLRAIQTHGTLLEGIGGAE